MGSLSMSSILFSHTIMAKIAVLLFVLVSCFLLEDNFVKTKTGPEMSANVETHHIVMRRHAELSNKPKEGKGGKKGHLKKKKNIRKKCKKGQKKCKKLKGQKNNKKK